LIRLWSSMSPPSFPQTCPCPGAPFPPRGPSGRFPRFDGTVKHSDFLPPLPRRFVSFTSRYRRCALCFVPAAARRNSCGPGVVHRSPLTGFIDGDDRISQVPGGPHYERALLFDPGGTVALGHCRASVLPSATFDDVDSHQFQNFEAQSHGPFTRCLRFAGWVAPPPRKTRFRMAGQPFRVGLTTHWVLTKGFRYGSILLSQALPGAPEVWCKNPVFCEDVCDVGSEVYKRRLRGGIERPTRSCLFLPSP